MTDVSSRAAKRSIITTQCFGMVAGTVSQGMILLLYMKALGMDGAAIVLTLSIQPFLSAILGFLGASWADRRGIKRIGFAGMGLTALSIFLLIAAGWVPPQQGQAAIVLALVCSSVGMTFFGAGWLALLFPLIPSAEHGRFFARLRTSFQVVGIVFSAWCMWMLKDGAARVGTFQLIFWVALAAQLVRFFFYHRIPELEAPNPDADRIWATVRRIWRIPRFAPFSVYLFLFFFFTANRLALFGLVEKEVLAIPDSQVVLFGMLTQIGLLAGYGAGGWAVDRYKTKKVFVASHLVYATVLLLFVLRGAFGSLMLPVMGTSHFMLGFVSAGVSIAIVTERLALLPKTDRSLASAMTGIMISFGVAGGIAFSGLILKMNVLRSEWNLFGLTLSDYDALIILYGVMVVLMLSALAPLPDAARSRMGWLPRDWF